MVATGTGSCSRGGMRSKTCSMGTGTCSRGGMGAGSCSRGGICTAETCSKKGSGSSLCGGTSKKRASILVSVFASSVFASGHKKTDHHRTNASIFLNEVFYTIFLKQRKKNCAVGREEQLELETFARIHLMTRRRRRRTRRRTRRRGRRRGRGRRIIIVVLTPLLWI